MTTITSNDLQQKIQGYLDVLALETDQARKSEEMQKYLDFVAKFHQYSPTNIMLILLSKPDATHVMGFNSWKRLNRFVKRGERGIPIFAPMIHKEDPDDDNSPKLLLGFRVVYVFDVSQTDGKPVPSQPIWKSLQQNDELRKRLMDFASSKGIEVTYQEFHDETQGMSLGKKIVLSPTAGVKTIIHELSHELLHQAERNGLSRHEKELEAESTAYIVCRHFGITDLACPNYIALHGATGELILQHFQRILGAASEFITTMEDSNNTAQSIDVIAKNGK